MNVFVLSSDKKPLTPCHSARARQLMRQGRAAVFRRFPFTIIIKDRELAQCEVKSLRLKLDPGSKITGIAVVQEESNRVIWAAELQHRGHIIRDALKARNACRRARRNRKTRYRAPRFDNRCRPAGWLPPSLQHRVDTTMTWVRRLERFAPISKLSVEDVKFDTQKLQNPEVTGVEYQKGELAGYEVREYLLEKWHRKCAYCGKTDIPLQVEHIEPVCRGGSNRVSNLTLSCKCCNNEKGTQSIKEFLVAKPEKLAQLLRQAKNSLSDMAAVNSTRKALLERLLAMEHEVETGSGAQTKMNREAMGLPKLHWIDAACVGGTGATVLISHILQTLKIIATGHGLRKRCRTNAFGIPIAHAKNAKKYAGFQTGDHVIAIIPDGKFSGRHVGRVAIRHRPSFRLNGFDVNPKNLRRIQRADGYAYKFAGT